MTTATTLQAQKRVLRSQMGKLLRAIPPAALDAQSSQVAKRILDSNAVQRAQSIAVFLSMPTAELRTDAIARGLLARGKTLYVPRVVPASEIGLSSAPATHSAKSHDHDGRRSPDAAPTNSMQMLRVRDEADLDSIQPQGKWGLREPAPEGREAAGPGTLDLILVPGVAFDRSARPKRLGHGKGYYDTFLSSLAAVVPAARMPQLVGLALQEQVLDTGSVPAGDHDWTLDAVLTADGFVPSEPEFPDTDASETSPGKPQDPVTDALTLAVDAVVNN
ncbi:nagb/rpia/CoA transferase-like protein [Auricularia subglabra TFB-10046 SS5]|nr:nagb/rpia/CoA transferase-like protein [Auricularia subglabra TFB-10046 SS5]